MTILQNVHLKKFTEGNQRLTLCINQNHQMQIHKHVYSFFNLNLFILIRG